MALVACGDGEIPTAANDAIEILPPPANSRVLDAAEMLDDSDELAINQKAAEVAGETGDQIYVVTLPSLHGRTIEDVGLAYGNGWGIGDAELDNGVLITVALAEQRMRIDVGEGLEGLLTDAEAARIINDVMSPHFSSGQFGIGIQYGVDAIGWVLRSDLERPQRLEPEMREAA